MSQRNLIEVSVPVFAAVVFTTATAFATGPPSATFAPGAVTRDRLIVLGNWPNGREVTPPTGTAVKTFSLQECNVDYTGCTSVFGNYANSPSVSEKTRGQVVPCSAFQQRGTTPNREGNTTFGTAKNTTTSSAYPKSLPSSSDGTTLTFQTFQPIVWTLTAPTG